MVVPEVSLNRPRVGNVEPLQQEALSPYDEELVRKFYDLKITHLPMRLDAVRFLMESRLAYAISGFQNSTKKGQNEHEIRPLADGDVAIKCIGGWEPLSEIQKRIFYDRKSEKLCSHLDANEVWCYISPAGLVRRDQQNYLKLEPVEELSAQEFTSIKSEASHFFDKHPEVDPGKEKKCVLQVVTTKHFAKEARFCGLESDYTEHVGLRLIDEKGKVFSFGLELNSEQGRSILHSSPPFPFTAFKTTSSVISSPDFDEFLKFHEKQLTSIPITKEKLHAIIKFVEEQNKLKVRFNAFKQTCASFGREILKLAGCSYPEQVSLGKVVGRYIFPQFMLPDPVLEVVNKIQNCLSCLQSFWQDTLPSCIQQTISLVTSSASFVVNKIVTVFRNFFVVLPFGGWAGDDKIPKTGEDDLDNRQKLTSFSSLIRSPEDLLRDDLTDSDQVFAISDWQQRQSSTKLIKWPGHLKMHY